MSTKAREVPSGWPLNMTLRTEHVWDGFTLLALLEHHAFHLKSCLMVPDSGKQDARLLRAVRDRNAYIATVGQPHSRHACKKCMHVFEDEETGKTSTFGITRVSCC